MVWKKMNANIINSLENAGVKATPMRMLVLEQMLLQHRNLTLSEIENLLSPADRITIYRTLQTFVKSGIAHVIENAGTVAVYALCAGGCSHQSHTDSHPHFICEQCGNVTCCTDFVYTLRQKPHTPEYMIHKVEMTLKGVCAECMAGLNR
jgi:Fur family ferric uptake transcriptional regulator